MASRMDKSSQGMTTSKTIDEQVKEKFEKDVNWLRCKISIIRSATLRKVLELYGNFVGLSYFWDDRHEPGRRSLPSLKAIMSEVPCSRRAAQDYRSAIEIMQKIKTLEQEIANFAGPKMMKQVAIAQKELEKVGGSV